MSTLSDPVDLVSRWRRVARSGHGIRSRIDVRSPGWWLELIGVAHLGVGATVYHGELADIVKRGVFNSVGDRGPEATAWWFLVAAPATWSAGRLMRALERDESASNAVRAAGMAFVATGVIGVVVMPLSPFWAVAATGVAAVRAGRQRPDY